MWKPLRGLVGALIISVAVVACGGSSGNGGGTLKIKMIGQGSAVLPEWRLVEAPFIADINKSNGRITIDDTPWDQTGLDQNREITILRSGQADIMMGTLSKASGDIPLLEGADLAGLNPTGQNALKAINAIGQVGAAEMAKVGVKLISSFPGPAQVIYCKQALQGLKDLKGRRVRTFGNSLNDFVTAAGGQSVSIAQADVYSAMSTGVIDCAITGTSSGNALKWYEVAHYLYPLPLSWSSDAYFVNVQWWNSLSSDNRAFLQQMLLDLAQKVTELELQLTQDGINCNTAQGTCQYGTVAKPAMIEVKPSSADQDQVKQLLSSTIIPKWVSRCGSTCGDQFNKAISPIDGVSYQKP